MTNYQKRKEKNDEYRSKIMRFTSQLSLGDGEVRDWFEQQPEKGAYLKDLILRDKAEWLGYREQKSAEPDKAGDYEIMEMSRNVQSGNTQNLKSMVIQRSFPKWSVAERRKTAAASNQAACCACTHSRYLAGGSPSGLRV